MRNRLRPKGRYSWRYQAWLAAAALVSATVVVPNLVQAAAEAPPAASGVKVEEVVVSKTPYYTNIGAMASGKIENYNSFKLNDPFRIVVDIWGVAQGAVASELPAGTPQVKSVKLSQQGDKLRMLVETPDDAPFPFLVTTEGNRLVLSVGGGQEGKVTSLDRPAAEMDPSKGKTVVGIIWSLKAARALVEDSEGKGYTVAVGTKIGQNGGVVTRITDKEVFVREEFRDYMGKKVKRDSSLKLQTVGGI